MSKSLNFKQPLEHLGEVLVTVWPVCPEGYSHEWLVGLGGVTINAGCGSIRFHLSPEQMREMAAALVAQSWEVEKG